MKIGPDLKPPTIKKNLISIKNFKGLDGNYGGTGLGLAISKALIEMMEGEMEVESKEGIGSSFSFTAIFGLQKKQVELAKQDIHYPVQCTGTKPKKVLLAEDDLVSRKIMTIILKKKGFQVIAVENGEEAVSAYEKEKFDLILMDVNMPYLDGFAATAQIRSREKNLSFHTPIIAMTAYALKGDREKCLESGMDDYLCKPIDISQVMEIIDKYVFSNSIENNGIECDNFFTETIFALMEATGFDKQTSETLLNDFYGQAVNLIIGINKHIAENNLEGAGMLLHQLKGSAGNVRVNEIYKQALVAEKAIRLMDKKMLNSSLQRIEKLLRAFENAREG